MLQPDNDRERLSLRKGASFLRLLALIALGRAKPAARLSSLDSLQLLSTLERLSPTKVSLPDGSTRNGVVLLDFDGTLAPRDALVLPERSLALVQLLLSRGYVVAVLSNKRATANIAPRYAKLEALGVHVARNVEAKPSRRAFRQTLAQLSQQLGVTLSPRNAVMIGDKQSTDGGSTLVGIPFIEVAQYREA